MPTLAYYRRLGFCLNLSLLCKTEVGQAGPLIFSERIFPFTSDLERSVAIFSTDDKALKQTLNIVLKFKKQECWNGKMKNGNKT